MDRIEIGNTARLVQPVVQGVIADVRYNKDAKQLEYFMEYVNEDGEVHTRWFLESKLEEVSA